MKDEESPEKKKPSPPQGADATRMISGDGQDQTRPISNDDATQAPPHNRAAVFHLRPGDVLKDRFRLEQKLGEGGMGAVYLAIDQRKVEAKHDKPQVAIKLISGDFARDSRAFIALQRETDKSQTLAHPNIITVYDFDRDGDVFFMTMEALSGSTLDEVIDDQDLTLQQRLGLVESLSKGIAYAHQRNIVHSDIKPQNIFVTDEGELKVLDFGIARALADADGKSVDRLGEIVGLTPAYASCEMLERCEPHAADDVYALGLIAYELLSGKHPFDRKKATVARAEGLRPKKIKGVADYQWRAIAKALEFDRDKRWQNAEQFLRRYSGAGRRVRQLSAALLLAIAAFGGFLFLYEPEAGPEIPFAELPVAKQEALRNSLNEARQARSFGDMNGALFYLDKAYTLHPRNREVMAELNAVIAPMVDEMATVESPEQAADYLDQVEQLLKYDALSQNAELVKLQQRLLAY